MSKRTSTLAALSLLAITACGPIEIVSTTPEPASVRTAEPAKIDKCKAIRDDFKDTSKTYLAPDATYKVEQHFQRVIRYSCDEKVTSDQVETVQAPRISFDLNLPRRLSHKAVFVFNETTCASELQAMPHADKINLMSRVAGDGENRVEIWGDVGNGLLTFRIAPGLNRIFVRYYEDCAPKSVHGNTTIVDPKTPACEGGANSQTVLYPIQIDYSERQITEPKHHRPTPDYCESQKNRSQP